MECEHDPPAKLEMENQQSPSDSKSMENTRLERHQPADSGTSSVVTAVPHASIRGCRPCHQ
jgi:hypothetical protein